MGLRVSPANSGVQQLRLSPLANLQHVILESLGILVRFVGSNFAFVSSLEVVQACL